jgi:hypothetical protein
MWFNTSLLKPTYGDCHGTDVAFCEIFGVNDRSISNLVLLFTQFVRGELESETTESWARSGRVTPVTAAPFLVLQTSIKFIQFITLK